MFHLCTLGVSALILTLTSHHVRYFTITLCQNPSPTDCYERTTSRVTVQTGHCGRVYLYTESLL